MNSKIRPLPTVFVATLILGVTFATGIQAQEPPKNEGPAAQGYKIADGPFKPTWESLKEYQCPEWFRDAKFGIWAVWGPESVPMAGDWYARNMYMEGSRQYKYHLEHYGHPSKFGFKDIVALWKAEKWDPERLMALYKQAGAKYFVVIANHHDNFDCWDSKYHQWNSVKKGPGRDVVGEWRKAALNQGLRFGVTEHNARSYSWFEVSHGADKQGPYAGVPYDGNDPKYIDFYHDKHPDANPYYPDNASEHWQQEWFNRTLDLLDSYQPDLFYFDGGYPFGEVGRRVVAHFYNQNIKWHGGKNEAVMNVKNAEAHHGEYMDGTCVLDRERGVEPGISAQPWQTDTCIGDWYYKAGITYKSPKMVVAMLADIVSKNGNLLLNVPLRPDGSIDAQEEQVLAGIGQWLKLNGEAIYGTRPWEKFGEGIQQVDPSGSFNEGAFNKLTAQEIRFTSKKDTLYAILLEWPQDGKVTVKSLPKGKELSFGQIGNVAMLGVEEPLAWSQDEKGLTVKMPAKAPCDCAYVLKITGK